MTPLHGLDDPLDLLRHELKNPLTTIYGRAQLLTRVVRRSPSLADDERIKLLAGLAVIEMAVLAAATVIDGIGPEQLAARPSDGADG
jgi:signal transduction histidine kinase